MLLSFVSGLRIIVKVAGFGHAEQKTPVQSIDWTGVFCYYYAALLRYTARYSPSTTPPSWGLSVAESPGLACDWLAR